MAIQAPGRHEQAPADAGGPQYDEHGRRLYTRRAAIGAGSAAVLAEGADWAFNRGRVTRWVIGLFTGGPGEQGGGNGGNGGNVVSDRAGIPQMRPELAQQWLETPAVREQVAKLFRIEPETVPEAINTSDAATNQSHFLIEANGWRLAGGVAVDHPGVVPKVVDTLPYLREIAQATTTKPDGKTALPGYTPPRDLSGLPPDVEGFVWQAPGNSTSMSFLVRGANPYLLDFAFGPNPQAPNPGAVVGGLPELTAVASAWINSGPPPATA